MFVVLVDHALGNFFRVFTDRVEAELFEEDHRSCECRTLLLELEDSDPKVSHFISVLPSV